MNKLAQGAEAVLWLDKQRILKERLVKGYRIPELDAKIRKFRTRREAKVLQRLQDIDFPSPHLQDFCDKRMSITMDFVQGEKLKNVLTQNNFNQISKVIGENIAKLHDHDIVHGDLTTSNMILKNSNSSDGLDGLDGSMNEPQINFIDFGLSSFSDKVEDKAVDLFLLDRALESTHANLHPAVFDKVLEIYEECNKDAVKVLERLQVVKNRGRNKNK
jgi:Kae1-associated kinase Bud32